MRVVWREVPTSKVFQTCLLNGNGTYTCYDYMNGKITHPFLLGVGGGVRRKNQVLGKDLDASE